MAALRVEALHAYRHLMRAQRHRFAGDLEMYRAARNESRRLFEENKGLVDTKQIKDAIMSAKEAAHFITHALVQGRLASDSGRYEFKYEGEHDLTNIAKAPAAKRDESGGCADCTCR